MTTEEAHAIAESLDRAGVLPGGRQFGIESPLLTAEDLALANRESSFRLAYLFEVRGPMQGYLYFLPILPHGEPPPQGCCGYDPSLLGLLD